MSISEIFRKDRTEQIARAAERQAELDVHTAIYLAKGGEITYCEPGVCSEYVHPSLLQARESGRKGAEASKRVDRNKPEMRGAY